MSGDFLSVLTVIVQKRLLSHLNCDKSTRGVHTTSEEKMNKVSKNQPNRREREGRQLLQAPRLSTPAYNAGGFSVGFTPTSPPPFHTASPEENVQKLFKLWGGRNVPWKTLSRGRCHLHRGRRLPNS